VRQEYKETDGNPLIKSRIRQIQRNMRKRQSLKAAATATVIVTNPTHYAVALKYEADMPLPSLSQGPQCAAEKIKQLARDNGIMLVENRPLRRRSTRALKSEIQFRQPLQGSRRDSGLVFRAQARYAATKQSAAHGMLPGKR